MAALVRSTFLVNAVYADSARAYAATLGDREVVGAMLVAGAVTGSVHWVPLAERAKVAGSLVDTRP
ncbi:hypothetical protein Aros01_03123 [Streptosporangium roseum]|uniref:Uncharacterized protein n=1 Tax=Streptosporangium roseum (strain ATCC 12428 / DSM 43021 / JCM 3005 / KCTC 9067 / NCIMB 10171 / NRRL 2505 / NI 9100) TaxID=479432 RepID=D2AZF8_STRRD|nr:hypothetical protein Sros_0311 [Streptosporangium roseum DSM 43021]